MPSFYARQSANQMPLTPPDSGSGYGYSNMHYQQYDPYASHQSMSQPLHDSTYDYQQQPYMQPSVAPAPPRYSYQPSNSLPPIQNYYEPIGAPILPPLRIQDHEMSFTDDYNRRLQQQQQQHAAATVREQQAPKEEKATGGVSAKLDYDMERMTDFVTEAVQSIFQHSMQGKPSFRKWVHQVLSATRLPSATILLSLHYLNNRVAHFPDSVAPGENQIYRLLAVSLILGSKFLDDNTFINRSWSDVTAIKVVELNLLEMKWLHLINYELHIDPKNQDGLQAWLDGWKEYDARYTPKQQQTTTRLSPLNTNVYRHHQSSRERYSPYPSPYSAATQRSYDTPHIYNSADPWARTDPRQQRYPTLTEIDDVNRRASQERARQSAYAYSLPPPASYYQPQAYGSGWDQQAWNGFHGYYSAQTVMG